MKFGRLGVFRRTLIKASSFPSKATFSSRSPILFSNGGVVGFFGGFGARGFRAQDEAGLVAALDAAFAHDGPSLVDVQVDPAGYRQQLQAMRG